MTRHAKYQIGQIVDLPERRGPQVGEAQPRWFAFTTPPLKEPNAKAWFEHHGIECWYPSETRWRRIPRGRKKKAPYEARLVPRYIFARFTGKPQWDVLQSSRWISGVIGIEGRPMPIRDTTLSQMAHVPAAIAKMRAEAEEAARVRAGDRVEIKDGSMQGWVVDVVDVHKGMARLLIGILGGHEATISVDRLVRLQALASGS